MTSRRAFFASVVGLGVTRPRAEEPHVWRLGPYDAAEEKRINDRWKRIDANLDRLEADNKAWDARFKAEMERMKADSDAWWERSQAKGKRIDALLKKDL